MTGDGDLQPANGNLQPKTVIFFRLSSTDDLIADPRYFCMAKTQLAKGAFNIILTKTRITLDSSWNAMDFVYCYDMDFVFDSLFHLYKDQGPEKLRALLNSYLEEHRKRRAIEACRVAVKVGMGDLAQSSAMQMGLMTAYPPFKFDTNHNLSDIMSIMKNWEGLKIPFEKIDVATEKFKTCIGRGGYGWVYKGVLTIDGKDTTVAVKRLNEQFGQGLKEFLTEIQLLFGQEHPNLISLLGYCDDEKEKIIIYEYAARGSLDRHIRRHNRDE
ncbi:serine-threonine/tyrosine-protein kinase catalytic domain-containing protein, partial [Tanacetum coccineum]